MAKDDDPIGEILKIAGGIALGLAALKLLEMLSEEGKRRRR